MTGSFYFYGIITHFDTSPVTGTSTTDSMGINSDGYGHDRPSIRRKRVGGTSAVIRISSVYNTSAWIT